jgi:hypothetical protein
MTTTTMNVAAIVVVPNKRRWQRGRTTQPHPAGVEGEGRRKGEKRQPHDWRRGEVEAFGGHGGW